MTTSDVSVVLCTYNGERFVRRQLTSILEQDLQPAEVIVSDDSSSDGTITVVESVASTTAIPVRIYRNERQLGFAENFLRACEHVWSPYIAFSDQDDDWYPDKLSTQRSSIDLYQAVLSTHPVDYIDYRGALLPPPDRGAIRDRSRKDVSVIDQFGGPPWGNFLGFTMLFARSLLERLPMDHRGSDPYSRGAALSHDRWVYFLASTFGRTVVVPQRLARYRQHDAQLYGGTKHRSAGERIQHKLSHGQQQSVNLSKIAYHRAQILEECGATRAARKWRQTAEQQDSRAELYVEASVLKRIRSVGQRVRSGSYSSPVAGGLGGVGLLEDVVVALGQSLANSGKDPRPPERDQG